MANEEKPDGLQFDKAEYAEAKPAETVCAACRQPIWQTYYEVGGQIVCERCHAEIELRRDQPGGVGVFVRAGLYGSGAGIVGAGIWYGVRVLTEYEVGIIAIAVGYLVGTAVRNGSGGRGGWLYQGLAVFLTYGAIVSTYVPDIVQGLRAKSAAEGPNATPAPAPAAEESPAPPPGPPRGLLGLAIALAFVMAIAFAAPFLGGAENIIGLVIIAIGLWEAWKINRRVPLRISGPYRVGAAPDVPAGG